MRKIIFLTSIILTTMLLANCDNTEKDTSIPVITLLGANPLSYARDSVFVDPGYTAIDDVDGDISSLVKVSGTVDTSTDGIYLLKYNVLDASGNSADEVTRLINVMVF